MGNLTEEEKKARMREYARQYYATHKEKVSAYYQENKEKIAARHAEYYAANKEEIAAQRVEYRAENKDKLAAYKAEYYAAHKEEKAAYDAAYRTTTHGRAVGMASTYKSIDRRKGFDTSENIDAAWIEGNVFSGQRCVYCGEEDWTKLGVDRINNALGHVPENCVCSCWNCNRERKNKFSFEDFVKYKKAALQ